MRCRWPSSTTLTILFYEQDQCIAIRKAGEVQTIAHSSNKTIKWHVAEVFLDRTRLGLTSLVVMSLHLSIIYAKRLVAGPHALEVALDAAMAACSEAMRPGLDTVRGDVNMARWKKAAHSCGTTPLTTSLRSAASCPSPIGAMSVASSPSANGFSNNSS